MAETLTEPIAFPAERASGCPFDPPPVYRQLQRDNPITQVRLWDGSTPWLVTGYANQRALLSDRRLSADSTHPRFPHRGESDKVDRSHPDKLAFDRLDGPEHARLRRMVSAPFTVKRAEALRPAIQRIVDDLIDKMLAELKPVDLVQALALPVPTLVICELLGVPCADHDLFLRDCNTMVDVQSTPEQVSRAQTNLFERLRDLLDRKLAEPDDDLLSRLAAERLIAGEFTRDELARIGMLVLVSGHETTSNMIALGVAALLEHPNQLAALRDADNPQLTVNAVEELLRYLTIVHFGRRRVALEDIKIDGQVIRAGEGVIIATDIGSRDPEIFEEPDQLYIHRDARRHLVFGFGAHRCLGESLARVELQVVYGTLCRRLPSLRLATDIAEIPFNYDGFFYGVHRLLVTW